MNINNDILIDVDCSYEALNLPENKLIQIKGVNIIEGLKNDVLELVQILPNDVYNDCCGQYIYHKKKEKEEKNEPID